MLSDDQLDEHAQAYVARHQGVGARAVRRLVLVEPPGAYYAVEPVQPASDLARHPLARDGFVGGGGFFVHRTTGEIVQFTPFDFGPAGPWEKVFGRGVPHPIDLSSRPGGVLKLARAIAAALAEDGPSG